MFQFIVPAVLAILCVFWFLSDLSNKKSTSLNDVSRDRICRKDEIIPVIKLFFCNTVTGTY